MTMTTNTHEMCREQANSTSQILDEIWADIDNGDLDAYERLDEMPLEVVWEKGEPFAVVLGTGGPHVEIRGGGRHDGLGYKLHVYWWAGEHVEITGAGITRTGECFRELVEQS